jgi:hypothetical protein
MSDQRYGVGFGPSLCSRRIGSFYQAVTEFKRLFNLGVDPRTLQVLPVIKCDNCEGKGEFINRADVVICSRCDGFRYVVDNPKYFRSIVHCVHHNREAIPGDRVRAAFMSKPSSTAADRRTWMVRITGESFPALVRVYPPGTLHGPSQNRTAFICDCDRGKEGKLCAHKTAAINADRSKFGKEFADQEREK